MRKEITSVAILALIMAFRMLGLFMILPVFSVYAVHIPGATAFLIGLALGIYGLTQAILQVPFGSLSDKIGRKPIILIGLGLFVIGSIVAALASTMTGIIIGRSLQGAGAIGSTVLATVADLTCDENRSKAMATLGLTIGLAFSVAMILGPLINAIWHLHGIFWSTAGLGIVGMLLVFALPTPPKFLRHSNVEATPNRLPAMLRNTQLLKLDFGIFALHATLTAMFIAIPIVLTQLLKLTQFDQVLLYLIVLVVAFVVVVPLIIIAEKRRRLRGCFLIAIVTLFITQLLLWFFAAHHKFAIALLLFVFFTAFTLLEATLPSWVSKVAPIRAKGTAMGIYSTSQFMGIFVGGLVGGAVFAHFGVSGIFVFCGLLTLVWLLIALNMPAPPYLSTIIIKLATSATSWERLSVQLTAVDGIAETAFMQQEQLLYVKIDKHKITEEKVRKLCANV